MTDFSLIAAQMIEGGQPGPMMDYVATIEGIRIETYAADGKIFFCHNLGLDKPPREEMLRMLGVLYGFGKGIAAASAEFRSLPGGDKPLGELYVFSGQMDFRVAIMEDGKVTWFVED